MKRLLSVLLSLFVFAGSMLLTSCKDKIMGYSVLLWASEEYGIPSGEVVPVYIKSNISHVYVAETPEGEKIELPLWQLTEPVKKNKIEEVKNKYKENAATYAAVKVDGLPGRAEAVNTSKQVYRFRKGEVLKVLYKGSGTAPMTGDTPLEGDWYRFLTATGVQGWCFSYSLDIYEAGLDGLPLDKTLGIEVEEDDGIIDYIADRLWYPEGFASMIAEDNIDTNTMLPSYNFKIDIANNKVSLNTEKNHNSWTYEGFKKTGTDEYTLTNIPVIIIYKNNNFIILRYTGASGKPEDLGFVILDKDLNSVLSAERTRRSNLLSKIRKNGPSYSSSTYGKITFNSDNSVNWDNFQMLVPFVIKSSAKNTGTVSMKYTMTKELAKTYDGIITFRFTGLNEDVNFLYKFENGGLRLEDTSSAVYNGYQIKTRSQSPVIMYFSAN